MKELETRLFEKTRELGSDLRGSSEDRGPSDFGKRWEKRLAKNGASTNTNKRCAFKCRWEQEQSRRRSGEPDRVSVRGNCDPRAMPQFETSLECGRLPPISSLLGMADQTSCLPSLPSIAALSLPPRAGGTAAAFVAADQAFGLDATHQSAVAPHLTVTILLEALKREQMKTQALQAQMLMQSASAQQWVPGHAHGNYDGPGYNSDEACGDKRRSHSMDTSDLPFLPRKRRVHVKSACVSCKNSHIACDDQQPCRNCVRRGCRCQRPLPKPAAGESAPNSNSGPVVNPAEASLQQEIALETDAKSSAPTATASPKEPSSPSISHC